jgi:hypothetical protein
MNAESRERTDNICFYRCLNSRGMISYLVAAQQSRLNMVQACGIGEVPLMGMLKSIRQSQYRLDCGFL